MIPHPDRATRRRDEDPIRVARAGAPSIFERIDFDAPADATHGAVRWSPRKSLWWSGMLLGWITLGTTDFSWSAVLVFVSTTALTLCLGHSIGMHRKLIHDSFRCPTWVERVMVYCGTLVDLGGPFTMMHAHDMRDWAQRQAACHPFLSHQSPLLQDFRWQLHCKLHLTAPPDYQYPDALTRSRFYRTLQATSMLQQVPLALLLYALGGWGWVAWGVCARVVVSIFGHWIVGFFAHNTGHRDWHLRGAAVQGYNVRGLGLVSFGECWHNNHHAFPGSARLGLFPGQLDPGWIVLQVLEGLGLAWNLQMPEHLPKRRNLLRLSGSDAATPASRRPALLSN